MAVPIKTGLPPLPMMKFPSSTGEEEVVLRRDLPLPGKFRWYGRIKRLFLAAIQNGLLTESEFESIYQEPITFLSEEGEPSRPAPPEKRQPRRPRRLKFMGEPVGIPGSGRVRIGDATVDFEKREVEIDGKLANFEPREYLMMAFLVSQNGPVTKGQIMAFLRQNNLTPSLKAFDMYLSNLRAKLGTKRSYLQTVAKEGYIFKEPAALAAQ